ncbi:MAG: D-2-hydroxyacid dehydrogenase [Pirellulaceae bacterium]|nr:D-2-hydroxyacid dehydrogenase [Pirellulaceae bacterium]
MTGIKRSLGGWNIVLCYPVEERHRAAIAAAAPGATIIDAGQEGIGKALYDADIFIGHAKVPVPWDEVVQQGRLKWIQSSAAGLDHCLVPSVIASPIPVCSASGLFANQVAEQTLALLLGLLRGLPTFFRQSQNREFVRRPTGDLHGQTVGIVGLGGNGRRLTQLLAPFRTQLLATDYYPVRKPAEVAELLPADRLLEMAARVDTLILCLPLNASTEKLIDGRVFSAMRPGSRLINVARGQVVDETDLIAALQSGHLSGAGLDVTYVEPLPENSPLWSEPQVIITPHVGAQAASRVDDSTRLACENLRRFQLGEPLLNLVDKDLGFPHPDAMAVNVWSA